MPANYYMPGNVVNPSNDPIVNERLRGLLAAGVDDVRTPGAGANFGKGLLSGVLGLPGDVMSLMSEIPARLPGPQQGAAEQIRGLLGNITSDGLAERMGADLSRPVTQAGLIGAPDPKDITDIPKGLLAMTLFHGTPHKFNKFDLSKIGTGEGAQAYGHGLYFAQNPGVAKQYQAEVLSPRIYEINDELQALSKKMSADEIGYRQYRNPETNKLAERYDELMDERANLKGHLYEVDIPDETVDKMLDWDAPLSEQPENIKKAFADLRDEFDLQNADGHTLYRDIQSKMPSDDQSVRQQMTSDLLKKKGIPGIRFFDGDSRKSGEGTRNIVVFDPNDIRQVKRDGIIVDESKLGISKPASGKGLLGVGTYDAGQKYHQQIPEVKSININELRVRDAGEVRSVSDDVAKNMNFDEPIEVSVFADGEMVINDGHHRVAAAKKRGIESLPVKLQAINAKGDVIQRLVEKSK